MLVEGLQVMLVGVVAVFAFLGLLVVTLWLTGRAVGRWERSRPGGGGSTDEALAAGAAVAVVARQRKERA